MCEICVKYCNVSSEYSKILKRFNITISIDKDC